MIENPVMVNADSTKERVSGIYRNASAATATLYDRAGNHLLIVNGRSNASLLPGDLVAVQAGSTQTVSAACAKLLGTVTGSPFNMYVYQITADGFTISIAASGGNVLS